MTRLDFIEVVLFILALAAIVPLLGHYLTLVFTSPPSMLKSSLGKLETGIYKLCNIDSEEEMNWKKYLKVLVSFNFIGLCFLFLLQLLQNWLPLNPESFSAVNWPLALNTAISFVTNTNWQSYTGENSLSYFTQASGLTVQNFLSAATGNAVLLAFIRGARESSSDSLGNYWKDLVRTIVYVLLPFAAILAVILISQGTIQNIHPYENLTTIENHVQKLPGGPVASQIAIKQLGTNGGGFFGANGAHPLENPTPLTNFLETFALLAIPAALTYMYGSMLGNKKQGFILCYVMFGFWLLALFIALFAEWSINPVMEFNPVLEGKETRAGVTNSVLWAISTTSTSNGSVNMAHESLSPIAGGMALFQMILGEIIFGGIGTGLCGMIMFVLLTVFLAGLMVGRSPEYLGKKIEKTEIWWAVVAIITPAALTLLGTSLALLIPEAQKSISTTGPHGLTEILYDFASTSGGNGSSFSGLNSNTLFYNLCFGLIMLLSRLAIIAPSLAIAGSLAVKKVSLPSLGTFRTDNALFGILLSCIILIIAGLTFFPAFSLGPIVEHLLMLKGHAF